MREYRVEFYVDNVKCALVVGAQSSFDARRIVEMMFYGHRVNIINVY